MTTRREFLTISAGALALQASGLAAITPSARPLDLLFLGGTGFLGPHEINYALARGHRVTMFNRGSNPGMYGDAVEEIIGNRDSTIDEGLAVDAEDHLYVVDVHFEAIQVFNTQGQLLLSFGQEGHGPGQFWLPSGIHIDSRNRIWVADSYNRRVQVFQFLAEDEQ